MTKSLPEPLMLDGKPYYSACQIAEMRLPGLPGTRRGVKAKALSESWPLLSRPSGRGGGRVYPLEALPDEAQAEIRRRTRPKPTQPAPANSASTQEKPNHKKRLFLGLGPDRRARVEAKAEAVVLWRHYKKRVSREISIPDARKAFCGLWKAGQAGAEERAHKALPSFAVPSLYRWDRALEKGGLNALVDQRGQAQAGRGTLDKDTQMREVVLGMLAEHPHAGSTHLAQGLAVRFPSCPHRLPSVRTIQHWTKQWKEEKKVLWAHLRDPDAAKGRYAPSVGRADEGVDSLNALWEVDATIADVLLSDGQRHTILGIIDVWSRRVLLHVTRTSPSTAVCTALRRAILAWGVPDAVRCDNGKEFISHHARTALKDLGIEQKTAPPFQPERKPFIERALGTFSHDLLELLPGFCGHDVSDRQAIRSRRSFSARFGQGENAEGRLTPEAFQEFCDKWCALYASRKHRGLGGLTPASRASSWIAPVRMIEDERALDILLLEPAQGGVHKKGISVGGLWHVAADLGVYIGRRVRIRLDEGDAGKIFVFSEDAVFLCEAVAPERIGVSRRELAQATRKVQGEMLRKARKAIKAVSQATGTGTIAREILAGVEPEASAETPRRSTPARTPALEEAVRAAHPDEVPEPSPLCEEQDDGADALARIRKRKQANKKRWEEEQRKKREEGERRLAKERAKVGDPWPELRFERIVV